MYDCFLHLGSKVVVNKRLNQVYLATTLRRMTLDIRDSEGKFVSLESLIYAIVPTLDKQWEEEEWISAVSGMLQVAANVPTTTNAMVNIFNAAFGVGLLFERVRRNKGLTMNIIWEDVTSKEVDEVFEELMTEVDNETDIEEMDGNGPEKPAQ